MATKSKSIFKSDTSGLLSKKKKIKKTQLNADEIESTVSQIHSPEQKEEKKEDIIIETKEAKPVRISVKLPRDVYKKMKTTVVHMDTTVNDYFNELCRKDLNL